MKFLRNILHRRQRKADLEILWPAIKDASPDLDTARAAFFLHAAEDPAWLALFDGDTVKLTQHVFSLT